jgi:hypothetical protein
MMVFYKLINLVFGFVITKEHIHLLSTNQIIILSLKTFDF